MYPVLKKMSHKLSDRHYHHVIRGFFSQATIEMNGLDLILSLAYQNEIVKKGITKNGELQCNSPAEKIFLFISDHELPSQN
jgi:hypothetical protein